MTAPKLILQVYNPPHTNPIPRRIPRPGSSMIKYKLKFHITHKNSCLCHINFTILPNSPEYTRPRFKYHYQNTQITRTCLSNELKSVTINDRGWLIEINERTPWLVDRDQRKREWPKQARARWENWGSTAERENEILGSRLMAELWFWGGREI